MTESLSEVTILVVDDNEFNRELLIQDLEEEGFTVTSAASGAECLRVAEATLPEVILLDIQMPEMDGIETCRRLKQNPITEHIPVVFVTAERTDDASAVEALAAGGNDFLSKPYSAPILLARVTCQVTTARVQARLRKVAITDELTGVYSRRFLFESLRRELKAAARATDSGSLACLLMDVDNFKLVNDLNGHIEGDRILALVASTANDATRETDVVSRYGGDEFVVVLPATGLGAAIQVAEDIRANIERLCAPVTVSIGVGMVQHNDIGNLKNPSRLDAIIKRLLRDADSAVYSAKGEGRNRVVRCAD